MTELQIRSGEHHRSAELYQTIKGALESEGIKVESAEEYEEMGLTGTEIVFAILISFSSSVAANMLQPKIDAALKKVRRSVDVHFSSKTFLDHSASD